MSQMANVTLLRYETRTRKKMNSTEDVANETTPLPPIPTDAHPLQTTVFFPPSHPLPPPNSKAQLKALNYRQHRAISLVAPTPQEDEDEVEFHGHKFVARDHLKPSRLICAFCKESIQWFGRDSYR